MRRSPGKYRDVCTIPDPPNNEGYCAACEKATHGFSSGKSHRASEATE